MATGTRRPWWAPPPSTVTAPPSAPPFPSPPSSFTADPPEEFLCPISGSLMADPVVVPPGQTFERACIQVCAALAFSPPAVAADLAASVSSSSPLVLVPNVALRTAILNWCDRLGLPHPAPLSPDTAHDIVCRLMPPQREDQSSKPQQRPQVASSVRFRRQSVDGFAQEPSPRQRGDALEEEIMAVLGAEGATPAEQASAMASLRQATRENREVRRQLCTPRLLAALRPMLLSADAGVQSNAAAAMVNLSLEPENKVRIVRSGAVSPLVDVLRGGHPEARDHAAGAMYSLAVEDENRAAIGVLGAIPPLLELFAGAAGAAAAGYRARGGRRGRTAAGGRGRWRRGAGHGAAHAPGHARGGRRGAGHGHRAARPAVGRRERRVGGARVHPAAAAPEQLRRAVRVKHDPVLKSQSLRFCTLSCSLLREVFGSLFGILATITEKYGMVLVLYKL